MSEPRPFGDWLKRRRKALDLTQAALADQVGCSAATIRKLEDEERRPSAQIVDRLAEVFKVPSDERVTFLRFARGDWRAAPKDGSEDAPWSVDFIQSKTLTHRHNLPIQLTSFIAREAEIALVHQYLLNDDIRLVTLIGPPGIGKTRLSIEAARASLHYFPDGVFFGALAPLEDPALIPVTVAQALGYVETGNISAEQQLKESIGAKKVLIVLDNCEHLIEGAASLTSQLLSACSQLKILATSRESLRIPGEWLYPVPAFDVPGENSSINLETASDFPALTLFAERARAVRPDFAIHADNVAAVATICARLDGLPLAIELIAARMRLMSPEALLTRMNNQYVLSADGMRIASGRQKTLQDAIDWSHSLLSYEEQQLFAYLSVFSGGFTLQAAEALFSQSFTNKPVSDLIASLLDKSLLKYDAAKPSEVLYMMLVTIQEFARTRLKQLGEETEIRNRHLAYFLDLAENADHELRGHHQLEWLSRLHSDRDNLRTALDWAMETQQTEAALHLAESLHWFWFVRGDHTEGRRWLRRVLTLPDAPLYPGNYARVLTQLANHTWLQIGPGEARPLVEQALSIARAHNDKWNIAWALLVVGLVSTTENDFKAAQPTLEESKALFREVDDQWGYANAVMALGLMAYNRDDRAMAMTLHEQALMLYRELGDRYFQGVAHRFLGLLWVKQGNWMLGQEALREALMLARNLNSKWEIYAVIWSFAEAAQQAGDFTQAVQLYSAAKNIADSIGAWQRVDDTAFEDNLAACRTSLGESEFVQAMTEGRAMTMEQAIEYALENNDE